VDGIPNSDPGPHCAMDSVVGSRLDANDYVAMFHMLHIPLPAYVLTVR